MSSSDKAIEVPHDDNGDDDDDDDTIDEEQLEEYEELVQELGGFPDKVKINSLSMVAEDHAESKKNAKAIYNCIRKPLLDSSVSRDFKLPLVYVLDSILKNVKGRFVKILEEDAKHWMPVVCHVLKDPQVQKLKKVWNMWRGIFPESAWREMGTCFTNSGIASKLAEQNQTTSNGGIVRSADGTLELQPALRRQMQLLLDDMQSEVQNELEKVSLERLADIDTELLNTIKREAEGILASGGGGTNNSGNGGASSNNKNSSSSNNNTSGRGSQQRQPNGQQHSRSASPNEEETKEFFTETRPPSVLQISKEWQEEWEKPALQNISVSALVQSLSSFSVDDQVFTQQEAAIMTEALAAAAATSVHLERAFDAMEKETSKTVQTNAAVVSTAAPSVQVDPKKFTNDGVKVKDVRVIALLYEAGLPFVSSSDGRRFATQIELSNHLDYLFKKNRLEKSMERTEERGWYQDDGVWSGETLPQDTGAGSSSTTPGIDGSTAASATNETTDTADNDPMKQMVPADETRDKCPICNLPFQMVFDDEDGQYKYKNCREIQVLNDEVAANDSEDMLVHVTCWHGLGSPEVLTMDQILQ